MKSQLLLYTSARNILKSCGHFKKYELINQNFYSLKDLLLKLFENWILPSSAKAPA